MISPLTHGTLISPSVPGEEPPCGGASAGTRHAANAGGGAVRGARWTRHGIHRKTIGKPEENLGKPQENGGLPSGDVKHSYWTWSFITFIVDLPWFTHKKCFFCFSHLGMLVITRGYHGNKPEWNMICWIFRLGAAWSGRSRDGRHHQILWGSPRCAWTVIAIIIF